MRDLDEFNITDAVIESFAGTANPRLLRLLTSLTRHLHAFAREVEVTQAEWRAAIDFLTATGHMCDDARQEFILLSDVFGLSTLVNVMSNRKPEGATLSSVLGPFYVDDAPFLPTGASIAQTPGEPVLVEGRVLDRRGEPIADAELDVWQADPSGAYDMQDENQPKGNLRGRFRADAEGRYAFRSILPKGYQIPHDGPVGALLVATGRHPWRPAHLHVIASAPGHKALTTSLYIEGDAHLDSDAVFGVSSSLVVTPTRGESGTRIAYDFTLEAAAA